MKNRTFWTLRRASLAQRILVLFSMPAAVLVWLLVDTFCPIRHFGFWVAVLVYVAEVVLLLYIVGLLHDLEDEHLQRTYG